jgi:hypothetical protein
LSIGRQPEASHQKSLSPLMRFRPDLQSYVVVATEQFQMETALPAIGPIERIDQLAQSVPFRRGLLLGRNSS